MKTNEHTTESDWSNLCEEILDSCSWEPKSKSWAFHPKTWAEPVLYDDEQVMLGEAARFFGYNGIQDAMVY